MFVIGCRFCVEGTVSVPLGMKYLKKCSGFTINLPHQPVRLLQGRDDLAVVLNVIEGEGAALAVLEPFPGGLSSTCYQFFQ